jgi:hypothetical protein
VVLAAAHATRAHSAVFNGLFLDWSPPVTFWINPSCHLLPQVLEKLRASRTRGILVYPYWSLQPWFQEVQRLSAVFFPLPSPHLSVRSHHPDMVEPFVNREVQRLRLCVKDDLLQACVLLTTQGDNSRIRWSVSQECQHVLSPDIRAYSKKLLDTSPTLLEEVSLPVSFMLRNVSTLTPVFDADVWLLKKKDDDLPRLSRTTRNR